MEASGGFLEAKDSARAKMMQLTTISGMIDARARLRQRGQKGLQQQVDTMVTKPAMTTI